MCGAACVGLSRTQGLRGRASVLGFQVGRLIGYSTLGAVGAVSVKGLGWLSIHSALFRPVWGLFHVSALLIGVVLIWRAEQPLWLDSLAKGLWERVREHSKVNRLLLTHAGPVILGTLWALLPCGLLYSALWVAALSANPLEGAGVMGAFALASALVLTLGPWLWSAMKRTEGVYAVVFRRDVDADGARVHLAQGAWGVRLAGAALVAVSVFALWHGLVQNQAPWCISAVHS